MRANTEERGGIPRLGGKARLTYLIHKNKTSFQFSILSNFFLNKSPANRALWFSSEDCCHHAVLEEHFFRNSCLSNAYNLDSCCKSWIRTLWRMGLNFLKFFPSWVCKYSCTSLHIPCSSHIFYIFRPQCYKEKSQRKYNNPTHVLTPATEICPQSQKEEIKPRLQKFVYFLNLVDWERSREKGRTHQKDLQKQQ